MYFSHFQIKNLVGKHVSYKWKWWPIQESREEEKRKILQRNTSSWAAGYLFLCRAILCMNVVSMKSTLKYCKYKWLPNSNSCVVPISTLIRTCNKSRITAEKQTIPPHGTQQQYNERYILRQFKNFVTSLFAIFPERQFALFKDKKYHLLSLQQFHYWRVEW